MFLLFYPMMAYERVVKPIGCPLRIPTDNACGGTQTKSLSERSGPSILVLARLPVSFY